MSYQPAHPESIFTYGAPQLKFGHGAADEIGYDLSLTGARRVLVITDPGVAATGTPQRVAEQMARFGIEAVTYEGAHVEPTDESLRDAIDFARENGPWDGFVAVGGGTSIDTAKAVDLLTTNPGELMDYINVPVGAGRAPTHPLAPLVAVPTTTGTGSESTTICVLDVLELKVKTGISHSRLRPTLAVIDPAVTLTQPAGVTASSGMDILCHALESWTARPYTSYEHKKPEERVPYCGSNPISDMWSEKAMRLLAPTFRRAVRDGEDEEARGAMSLAATFAGMGFGNAGVHVPHANAYPIAGRVKDFRPADYPQEEAMVPHGMSVALTAPEAFRFTFEADPDRHVQAARMLEPDCAMTDDPADLLPEVLTRLMRDIGIPNGIGAVGYDDGDVDDLVEGSLKQQRLLATAPREVGAEDLAGIFRRSMELW
ncbi:iron-containing alcohol dehydrogenase [Phycicoccus endophyticus]|uniref:hydroxyacid-oxoacid transhydrogenase n=1 Tax=Phycicoccus endophyticus TaxID=1690220 RepID=A0A7G9R0L3_9MICO|nr:hydroxyacid-oxoacid transhydrogenase [Phycicoccus endophyticus]NHI19417.1 iron-containing alcohol dehydrogenase [Phycicoccus endophyticus]QNN49138.1 iron-containing alcohol dehydrogenase [Phycicoccus endophyticus]GGL38926.1 alcohol dehydrogenase [Phycicoccus endophyticus]